MQAILDDRSTSGDGSPEPRCSWYAHDNQRLKRQFTATSGATAVPNVTAPPTTVVMPIATSRRFTPDPEAVGFSVHDGGFTGGTPAA
jgi:hypothetical protein